MKCSDLRLLMKNQRCLACYAIDFCSADVGFHASTQPMPILFDSTHLFTSKSLLRRVGQTFQGCPEYQGMDGFQLLGGLTE